MDQNHVDLDGLGPVEGGSTESGVQESIAQRGQEILARYPIAPSLLRGDAVPLLPTLSAHPPTAFAPSAAQLSLKPVQILGDFAASLALLDSQALRRAPTASQGPSAADRSWAERQMAVANGLIADELASNGIGKLRFCNPPHPVPAGTPAPVQDPFSSTPTTFASRHADALNMPYPTPTSLTSSPPRHPQASGSRRLFDDELDRTLRAAQEATARRRQHSRSMSPTRMIASRPAQGSEGDVASTPLKPFGRIIASASHNVQANLTPQSSPDPLALGGASTSKLPPRPSHPDPPPFPKKLDYGGGAPAPASSQSQPLLPMKKRKSEVNMLDPASKRPANSPSATPPRKQTFKIVIPPSPKSSNGGGTPAKKPRDAVDPDIAGALSRLEEFVEDLLEADDMLSPDIADSPTKTPGGSSAFFVPSALDPNVALLAPIKSRQLAKLVDAAAKLNPAANSAGGKDVVCSLNTGDVARVLKILERTIKVAEEVTVVPREIAARARSNARDAHLLDEKPTKAKGAKGKGKGKGKGKAKKGSPATSRKASRRGSAVDGEDEDEEYTGRPSPSVSRRSGRSGRSPSVAYGDEDERDEEAENDGLLDDETIKRVADGLRDLASGVQAADAAVALWTAGKLPKQVYYEGMITSVMAMVKSQLAAVVYPFAEADTDSSDGYSAYLGSLLTFSTISHSTETLAEAFSALLPRLAAFINQEDMSEGVLIHAGYVSVGPFFVEPAGGMVGKGKKSEGWARTGVKMLRIGALDMLRAIVARSPSQREWIVDEVLTSLTKLPDLRNAKPQYLLGNGKALHTVSALLLHLVQTCTYGIRKSVRKALRTKQATAMTKVDMDSDKMEVDGVDGAKMATVQEIVEPALASAMKIGRKIVLFLLQKSGKGSKTTSEGQYKLVYDHLIDDMLSLLYAPEWPVAEFMLNICCRSMITVLEDSKTSAEVNAAKSLCLEQLGPIVARLARPMEHAAADEDAGPRPSAKSFASGDMASIRQIFDAQHEVLRYLSGQQALDEVGTSAADLLSAQWAVDFGQAAKSMRLAACKMDEADEAGPKPDLNAAAAALDAEAIQMWDRVSNYLQVSTNAPVSVKDCATHLETVSACQGLRSSFDFFLDRVIATAASPSVTFRGKAIRAIGLIVAQDPAIFFQDLVRRAIESRLLDNSPAVRDAAVELVGKYIGTRPAMAVAYYPHIAARIADKGLTVRKRVVKLLKQIYGLVDDNADSIKIDVCRKLISRVYDEDDNIKDLAMDSIEDLWFSKASDATDLRTKSAVIMSVTAPLKERPSPMEETLKHVFRKHTHAGTLPTLRKRCEDVANTLIDEWMNVAASDRAQDFSEVDCIKTIYVMTTFSPGLLSASKANLLLPFLKGTTTPEEQTISEYLLRIFTSCVADMPKASGSKFGESLQAVLLPLLNKPNLGNGGVTLQELVACFCAAIKHQTHDFKRLANVFKACESRVRSDVTKLRRGAKLSEINVKSFPIVMFLVSSLVEHGDLETVRKHRGAAADIDSISKGPIHEHVYGLLADAFRLIAQPSVQAIVLTCLGFLFRAYPMLMTDAKTMSIMDDVFAGDNVDLHTRLLKIVSDFLTSQSLKSSDEEDRPADSQVDMDQLIGNNESFADSGVGLAVVQRYMGQVTRAAMSPLPQLHKPAIDIIGFTIRQGLAHPISSLPVLVSLQGGADPAMASKAFGLHSLLHTKRPELIHTRFLETTKAVFAHQTAAAPAGQPVLGFRGSPPRSLLAPWYSLLSQRRNWRLDLAKSLSKAFSIDPSTATPTQTDVDCARFVAEAVATLEWKTQEEVMTVVGSVSTSLAMYAYLALNRMGADESDAFLDSDASPIEGEVPPDAARASMVLGLGFILRDHLKSLYSLSDAKCAKFAAARGKKSKLGDAAATRRVEVETRLRYDRMPLLEPGSAKEGDGGGSGRWTREQREAFREMVAGDATLHADEDEDQDEDGVVGNGGGGAGAGGGDDGGGGAEGEEMDVDE